MIGAVATAAALIDRNRNGGIGRDVHASRLAGMYKTDYLLVFSTEGPRTVFICLTVTVLAPV